MEDLFGNEVPDVPLSRETSRRITNDMNQVMTVLERACSEAGYFVGPRSRVFRAIEKGVVKPVPLWESGAVLQLVASGQLTQGGGTHLVRCGAVRSQVHAVLVPRSTRNQLARWKALKVPAAWSAQIA